MTTEQKDIPAQFRADLDRYLQYSEEERLRARVNFLERFISEIDKMTVVKDDDDAETITTKLDIISMRIESMPDIDIDEAIAFVEAERITLANSLSEKPIV